MAIGKSALAVSGNAIPEASDLDRADDCKPELTVAQLAEESAVAVWDRLISDILSVKAPTDDRVCVDILAFCR